MAIFNEDVVWINISMSEIRLSHHCIFWDNKTIDVQKSVVKINMGTRRVLRVEEWASIWRFLETCLTQPFDLIISLRFEKFMCSFPWARLVLSSHEKWLIFRCLQGPWSICIADSSSFHEVFSTRGPIAKRSSTSFFSSIGMSFTISAFSHPVNQSST